MIDKTKLRTVEIVILICAVAGAAALSWPVLFQSSAAKRAYMTRLGAEAIRIAMDHYAAAHLGSYPPPAQITGTPTDDILLIEKHILAYPANPYSKDGGTMKNVPFNKPSPGNFSYIRNEEKQYQYKMSVYGDPAVLYSHDFQD